MKQNLERPIWIESTAFEWSEAGVSSDYRQQAFPFSFLGRERLSAVQPLGLVPTRGAVLLARSADSRDAEQARAITAMND